MFFKKPFKIFQWTLNSKLFSGSFLILSIVYISIMHECVFITLLLYIHICIPSGRWWRTGKPGVPQSMRSQRLGHNWVTAQQQESHLWKSAYSTPLSIEKLVYYWVVKILYKFYIKVNRKYVLQIFSPSLWLAFSFLKRCLSKRKSFKFCWSPTYQFLW